MAKASALTERQHVFDLYIHSPAPYFQLSIVIKNGGPLSYKCHLTYNGSRILPIYSAIRQGFPLSRMSTSN